MFCLRYPRGWQLGTTFLRILCQHHSIYLIDFTHERNVQVWERKRSSTHPTSYSISYHFLSPHSLHSSPLILFAVSQISQMCVCSIAKLWPHGLYPARLLHPWNFPGKNTGVGLPFTPPGDLPDPGIHPVSSVFPALAGVFFTTVPPGNAPRMLHF